MQIAASFNRPVTSIETTTSFAVIFIRLLLRNTRSLSERTTTLYTKKQYLKFFNIDIFCIYFGYLSKLDYIAK